MTPGPYTAVTRAVRKRSYNGARDYLVILFDLFASMEAMGTGEVPLARGVPGFFNLASGPGSRYSSFLKILFPDGRLPKKLGDLIGKAVQVEVVTVKFQTGVHYSKISDVTSPV